MWHGTEEWFNGGASGRKTGSCLGGSARGVLSFGRLIAEGGWDIGSSWGFSTVMDKGSSVAQWYLEDYSLSKRCHSDVNLWDLSNLTHFFDVASCGWVTMG